MFTKSSDFSAIVVQVHWILNVVWFKLVKAMTLSVNHLESLIFQVRLLLDLSNDVIQSSPMTSSRSIHIYQASILFKTIYVTYIHISYL